VIVGTGVDIVEIERMAGILERHGDRFCRRVFTPTEIEYCRNSARPSESFAARFAAKEAALKALGVGWQRGTRFTDVHVSNDDLGAPHIELHGRAHEISRELGIQRMHITISHDHNYAVAQVIAEGG